MGLGGEKTWEGPNAPVRASWSLEYTFALTQGSLCLECQPFACLGGLYAEADVLIALVCFLCRCNSRTLCRWRRASFRTSIGRLLSRAICLNALNAFGKAEILCVTGGLRFDTKILVAQMRMFLGNESAGGAVRNPSCHPAKGFLDGPGNIQPGARSRIPMAYFPIPNARSAVPAISIPVFALCFAVDDPVDVPP